MGIFSSCAQQAELEDLLKWVKENYIIRGGEVVVNFEELVAEIRARIAAADYD